MVGSPGRGGAGLGQIDQSREDVLRRGPVLRI